MPVQEEVIPYLLGENNDVIALAQTGTGKTAAYGIPVLQKTDATIKTTQALILSPTRELCLQIADDLKSLVRTLTGFTSWQYTVEHQSLHKFMNCVTVHKSLLQRLDASSI